MIQVTVALKNDPVDGKYNFTFKGEPIISDSSTFIFAINSHSPLENLAYYLDINEISKITIENE